MSQEHIELRGASVVELGRVDRILSELGRPVLEEDATPPSVKEALAQIGISVGGEASRRDLIKRVWGRKRALLRQMSALEDWGPMRPVA